MSTRRSSETTRAAILDAARRRFAADGYERTTIRAVAADAGIDPSMVMRYYGNKEGLFARSIQAYLGLEELADAPREALGETAVRMILNRWGGAPTLPILLRAATSNAAAADALREIFRDQLAPTIAGLTDDQPELRAGLMASQVLGLAFCRYVLRLPPVADMDTDTLVRMYAPTFQRYLTGPL